MIDVERPRTHHALNHDPRDVAAATRDLRVPLGDGPQARRGGPRAGPKTSPLAPWEQAHELRCRSLSRTVAGVEGLSRDRRATSPIVKDFDLTVREGEFVSIIGHSGCGKSTVLSMVAGLNELSSGGIVVAGPRNRRPGTRPRRRLSIAQSAAVAHRVRKRAPRRRASLPRASRAERSADCRTLSRARRAGRRDPQVARRAVARHAATRRPGPRLRPRSQGAAPGRAVRHARLDHADRAAGRADPALARRIARRP